MSCTEGHLQLLRTLVLLLNLQEFEPVYLKMTSWMNQGLIVNLFQEVGEYFQEKMVMAHFYPHQVAEA